PIIIGYLSARVVYEHLATKTMRFNGYLGNSPLTTDNFPARKYNLFTKGYVMQVLVEIFLAATEVLTVVIGVLGVIFSALLLFSPLTIVKWSGILNRWIDLDRFVPMLDRPVATNGFAYKHPIIFGIMLLIGSFFVLNFLFFQLETPQFTGLFGEILFEAFVLTGKLACFCGIAIGLALLFVPDKIKKLELKLDSWFDTDLLAQKLSAPIPEVDHVFLRHPLLFGAIGLLASFVLLILAAANLIR
ncbi:hypothetical protein D3OALGA1CA_3426, partial [Olavius algarvensis associated proteobacterium Delta 3]